MKEKHIWLFGFSFFEVWLEKLMIGR